MGDDGGDVETPLDHHGHLVPRFVHFPTVNPLDREHVEDHEVPVNGDRFGRDAEHGDLATVGHIGQHVAEGAGVAGHFQSDIETFLHSQLFLNVGEFLRAYIDGAVGPHFFGEFQSPGIHIGDDDVACPSVLSDGCGHAADRSGSGDQNVFTEQVEGQSRVDGVAEWVKNAGHVEVDPRGVMPDVGLWDRDVLGEGARAVHADALRIRAQVPTTGKAVAAVAADNVPFATDDFAGVEVVNVRTDPDDLPDEFMANDHRHRDCLLCPFVPVVNVDIGTADTGLVHPDEDIVDPDGRLGDILHPQADFAMLFDEGFHAGIPEERTGNGCGFYRRIPVGTLLTRSTEEGMLQAPRPLHPFVSGVPLMLSPRVLSACGVAVLLFAGCEAQQGTPPADRGSAPAVAPVEKAEPGNKPTAAATSNTKSVAEAEPDAPDAIPYYNPVSPEQAAEGWISLFDGHSFFGWTPNVPDIDWRIENESIVASEGPIGLLLTTVPWADYEFRCEYRMEAGGNSGVFLRTLPTPGNVKTDCYELNMADEHPEGYLTGSLVGRAKTAEPIQGSGDWKSITATAEGPRFRVSIDGKEVLDYTDDAPTARSSGLIGLQKNKGKIEFRKILLRPLGTQPLFNGTDLTGWREVPGSKSKFSVEEGVIRCVNGQGFLETERTFGDFVFQAEAKTHAAELNSGFFFRAMPGTEKEPSNGYEAQIHNGFTNGDRTQPNNMGTGAIFRPGIPARRVVSDDLKWLTMTLVASGNHISVWVDGYAVLDWIDDRKPDPNPRRGRRDEAGHISLQGHDPTTDMSFRNLRIAEFARD